MDTEANIRSTPTAEAPTTTTPGDLLIPCPFDIVIDPMQRLLLINFEKDPDKIYVGFEPQIFDDTSTERECLLLVGEQMEESMSITIRD